MPQTLLFCDLDLQSQGHWWPLKGQILAIFSHFGPVLIYRKLDHPMAGIYNTYIYILCKHAEIWPWSSSLKVIHCPPKYLTEGHFWPFYVSWLVSQLTLCRHSAAWAYVDAYAYTSAWTTSPPKLQGLETCCFFKRYLIYRGRKIVQGMQICLFVCLLETLQGGYPHQKCENFNT